ncbi:MAG: hypothetical protein ACLQBL_34140, partial [Polyangiaceae bacterium]
MHAAGHAALAAAAGGCAQALAGGRGLLAVGSPGASLGPLPRGLQGQGAALGFAVIGLAAVLVKG